MQLIFARHGESTANLTQTFANRSGAFPLTTAGLAQAERLAERCAGLRVTRLFTSPLLRAEQTAGVVATRLGLEPQAREGLREWDVGRWEGTSAPEGWAQYARVVDEWVRGEDGARMEGGESLAEVRARFEPFACELRGLADSSEIVLCIGHGGLLRAALPGFFANVTAAFAYAQPFPNTATVDGRVIAGVALCTGWCGIVPPRGDPVGLSYADV